MMNLSKGTPIRIKGERRSGTVTGRTFEKNGDTFVEYFDAARGGAYLAKRELCIIDRKTQRIRKAIRMKKAGR